MKVNTVALTQAINGCFDLSMNDGVPADQQKQALVLGKRLRGTLVNLLTTTFTDETKEVVDANEKLQMVNGKIEQAKTKLDTVAGTITEIGNLVGILDDLLKIAASML